ncbi:MAG TPA: T9SS type A sorting domain-containing protein [Draconibacterium sp.]|nr:T9SS type A sorting domain-containing protein [Draconibacterium sp.]
MKQLFTLLMAAVLLLNIATAQNVGQVAPDFTLKTLSNVDYKLSANRGKVILVFLIGYSCPFCIASSPSIKTELLDTFYTNTNFQALVIDTWDGSATEVNGFKSLTGLDATYLQKGRTVATSWTITYDRLVVIDSEGKMVFKGTRAAGSDVMLAKNVIKDALNNLTTSALDLEYNAPVSLGQNFPNPAMDNTNIKFSVASSGKVSLHVMDITGKVVATLIHGELQAGEHSIQFKTDEIPDGIYFYRLDAGNFSVTKKLIVNK